MNKVTIVHSDKVGKYTYLIELDKETNLDEYVLIKKSDAFEAMELKRIWDNRL